MPLLARRSKEKMACESWPWVEALRRDLTMQRLVRRRLLGFGRHGVNFERYGIAEREQEHVK